MNSFISPKEKALEERFFVNGYVIQRAEDIAALDRIRDLVNPHEPVGDLNQLKLDKMARLNAGAGIRQAYYSLAKNLLHAIVGNELAMQKKFNINVQVPHDDRNLLPIHADTWTGDSPYQVVLWVPLVDCYRTKAMWILPPDPEGPQFRIEGSSVEMFERIKPRIKYLDIKYGEVLLFNSTLPHGNTVNLEDSTRWSLNCRFKSVWTPYGRKELGEHFEPITLRAASRIGLDYRYPA